MDAEVSTKTKTFQNLNKNCPLEIYFDAAVAFFMKFSTLFRLSLAINDPCKLFIMYQASSGDHHFYAITCHRQTYLMDAVFSFQDSFS